MTKNERRLKGKKSRIVADNYDFLSFPTTVFPAGEPFRSSVRRFLSHHAARLSVPSSISPAPALMTWQIPLWLGSLAGEPEMSSATVVLDIIEKNVIRTRSPSSVYCNNCQVFGWGAHPVCRKRYHFIIRANSSEPFQRPCSKCATPVELTEARCKCCNSAITVNEIEDWLCLQTEINTHLLHGVVHSNGYGHLLTLNGREGGSKFLSGSDIMGFWERLCVALSVRKVSVLDFSKKFGLEYRLLHAITKRCSWYDNWGYEFCTGSYAITQDVYQKAVKTLSSMPLSSLLVQGRGPRTRLQSVIFQYQSLADTTLETIQDIFCIFLTLINKLHKPSMTRTSQGHPSTQHITSVGAWMRNDIENVQQAIIKVLLASRASKEDKWVSWRALKGVVYKGAASPKLVDYSLKHLGGKSTPNGMVVCSRGDPISNVVEFRIDVLSNLKNGRCSISSQLSKEQVISDLRFLLDSIVQPGKMASNAHKIVADSARKLLDCKQFMKDFKPEKVAIELPPTIRLWCSVELADHPKDEPSPPPELIILNANATLADLKSAVTSVFQEVYVVYKKFQAEKLPEFGAISDSYTLKFLLGTSGFVRIQGKCPTTYGLSCFRMERGTEAWRVDCHCGTMDDDGERMLACDNCGVWQHTRCNAIDDSDNIPSKFVCLKCIDSYGANKACNKRHIQKFIKGG